MREAQVIRNVGLQSALYISPWQVFAVASIATVSVIVTKHVCEKVIDKLSGAKQDVKRHMNMAQFGE